MKANPVRGVLKEELRNSRRMLERYKHAVAALPKGSLVEKKIKGRKFHYIAYRQDGKVKFEYAGRLSPAELEKRKAAKAMKARYRRILSELREQIVFLERSLHERRRRAP